MCFKLATIVPVTITSSDHELHFSTWTADQAPNCSGYRQIEKKVLTFSARKMKKPISTKARRSGIRRSRSSGRKMTVVLA